MSGFPFFLLLGTVATAFRLHSLVQLKHLEFLNNHNMECCRPQKLPQEAQKKQKEPHKNILDNKGSSIDPYGTPNKMSIH